MLMAVPLNFSNLLPLTFLRISVMSASSMVMRTSWYWSAIRGSAEPTLPLEKKKLIGMNSFLGLLKFISLATEASPL